jgi:urate oxidase
MLGGEPGTMSAVLTHNAYGKSRVRLTKVVRRGDWHEIHELDVDLRLEGDFAASYTEGDNRSVIATDTMRNIVYVLAHSHPLGPIEPFGRALASHFLEAYPQVQTASVRIAEHPWSRVTIDGRSHPHAFTGGSTEVRLAMIAQTREHPAVFSAGLEGLLLLKTTRSAFSGFVRDRHTTLSDAADRLFATELKAEWPYDPAPDDWDAAFDRVRRSLIETFAEHDSLSVQQTLHACGASALDACPAIPRITLTMPNKHRILFDLARFGVENLNEVFVTTDEPFGLISGTVERC